MNLADLGRVTGMSNEQVALLQLNFYFYRYDTENSIWRAISIKNPKFTATSEASFETLLLGTHTWTVHNDSSSCYYSQTYSRDTESLTISLVTLFTHHTFYL